MKPSEEKHYPEDYPNEERLDDDIDWDGERCEKCGEMIGKCKCSS